jgi:carbon storage regulator
MLVLTRGKDESIMIGEDIEVIIVDVRGNSVRLGISAPKSVPVHRREVFDAIHEREPDGRSSKSSVG